MNFSGSKPAKDERTLGDMLNELSHQRLEREAEDTVPLGVFSPSMINGKCWRQSAYAYFLEMEERKRYQELRGGGNLDEWKARKKFDGKMINILARGTRDEELTVAELRAIGFEIITHDDQGRQFGFRACHEKGAARYRGRIDGIVMKSPMPEIKTPCLWEHKALNHKTWTAVKSGGILKHKPGYYLQVQDYMATMDLKANPCMFTLRNKDSELLNVELIPFDLKAEADVKEHVGKIIGAHRPEDLPQAGASISAPVCSWCEFKDKCWTAASAPAARLDPIVKPDWI